MLYRDNRKCYLNDINMFGKGELFKQLKPLLTKDNIKINHVFDDTLLDKEYHIENYIKDDNVDNWLLYCVGFRNMEARYNRFIEIKEMGFKFISFISDNSILSDEVYIENGTIINQGAIIDNFVTIGECSFINIGSTISHHTEICNNVFIAPGVNIAGYVKISEGAFIGTNATIINNINIGEYSIVAAGAVVIEDVPPYTMVAGNPAKVKKILKNL